MSFSRYEWEQSRPGVKAEAITLMIFSPPIFLVGLGIMALGFLFRDFIFLLVVFLLVGLGVAIIGLCIFIWSIIKLKRHIYYKKLTSSEY